MPLMHLMNAFFIALFLYPLNPDGNVIMSSPSKNIGFMGFLPSQNSIDPVMKQGRMSLQNVSLSKNPSIACALCVFIHSIHDSDFLLSGFWCCLMRSMLYCLNVKPQSDRVSISGVYDNLGTITFCFGLYCAPQTRRCLSLRSLLKSGMSGFFLLSRFLYLRFACFSASFSASFFSRSLSLRLASYSAPLRLLRFGPGLCFLLTFLRSILWPCLSYVMPSPSLGSSALCSTRIHFVGLFSLDAFLLPFCDVCVFFFIFLLSSILYLSMFPKGIDPCEYKIYKSKNKVKQRNEDQ